MDFLKNAGVVLAQFDCEICDTAIEERHAVFFEVDGDDQRVKVRARHAWCHTAMKEAADTRELAIWEEAAKIAQHNTAADAVTAYQSRAQRMRRRLEGHSGADIPRALGLVS